MGSGGGPLTRGAAPPLFPSSFEVPEIQTHTGLRCKRGSSRILSIMQNPVLVSQDIQSTDLPTFSLFMPPPWSTQN